MKLKFGKNTILAGLSLALVMSFGSAAALGTNDYSDPLMIPSVDDQLPEDGVEFAGVSENGVSVSVTAPEGAFSENAEMTVSNAEVSEAEVGDIVSSEASGDILGLSAVDISFDGEQPSESVLVNMVLPSSEVPADASMIVIVHMSENGPEVVDVEQLDSSASSHKVSFKTGGFSSYAAVFVDGKYESRKMSDVLEGNSRYSITSFAVDLFDYDPVAINNSLNSATSDGNGFHFTGYGITGMGSNNGINNSSAEFAKQGILESTLSDDGLPVVKHLSGTDAGEKTGQILFSDTATASGKTIYKDIPFEFVYDNVSGWYEYKSSANHAQLSADGTKIEMYADTLSTQNKYVATLDLSKAYGESDMVRNGTPTKSNFSATVKETNNATRLDPYVSFPVDSVDASKVGQIYVKAKIPASVGTNNFQLFFATNEAGTNFSEDKSFYTADGSQYGALEYTPNGEWVEFIIDTSTNPNWTGTITGVRIDLFDGNKGLGVDKQGSYPVEIEQVSLVQKDYNEYATRGGFYPFSDIRDSFPGNNAAFEFDEWAAHMQETSATTTLATRSMGNSALTNEDLYAELAYGVAMEFDFYIPVGGQVDWGNGKGLEDLVYYFNGDDDLWVFVDGKLVLDIGGGHGAILGTANFTTGDVMVENAVKVDGYNSGATATASKKTGKMDATLYTPGKHTMKVFYLERGGSVSNCYMKFNLPQTPEGDVTVSKSTTGLDESILSEEAFDFVISAKDLGSGSTTGGQSVAWANKSYYLVDVATNTVIQNPNRVDGAFVTSGTGAFSLESGQEARFVFDENYQVTVTETPKNVAGYEHVQTKVNGAAGASGESIYTSTQVTADKVKTSFAFENSYRELDSTISYIPVNPDDCPDEQKGTVEITGQSGAASTSGVFETIGQRVGVPSGSTAVGTDAVKFVGWYDDSSCAADSLISTDPAFMPVKPTGSSVWEDATYYAKFEYIYGDLTISKSGVSALDNHAAEGDSAEERQSVLFNLSGTSYSGVDIDMDVVVHVNEKGEGSIKVENLPAGEYVVEEKTDWSWRYEVSDVTATIAATQVRSGYKVLVDERGNAISFSNSREDSAWLSGDNWCANLFAKIGS